MHYRIKQDWNELRNKFDHIIALGTGPTISWDYIWRSMGYELQMDVRSSRIGKVFPGGAFVHPVEYLSELDGEVLVVIYSIFENEIVERIDNLGLSNVSTIIFKLITNISPWEGGITSFPDVYAKNGEDVLLINQLGRLGIAVPQYLEIGVCHPVVNNNTYLLNQVYSNATGYRGVLVEANPTDWNLIEEYRPNDILIHGGVAPTEAEMPFYSFTKRIGHSTFDKEIAQKWIDKKEEYEIYNVRTYSINRIINDNFQRVPDVLSLDAEGYDFAILKDLDFNKYPIRIILCEPRKNQKKELADFLRSHGYVWRATTWENQMWVLP